MAMESIRVTALVSARPEQVYAAWLDAETHSKMTGGRAEIEAALNGRHSAWDGYIVGETLELEPGRRIVQSWRTTEFPNDSPDSRVVLTFDEEDGRTRVTIYHSDIPEGQGTRYETGWQDFYFRPMTAYFAELTNGAGSTSSPAKKTAAKKTAAKKGAVKKGAAKKSAAKKSVAKKSAAKKGATKKTAAKKGAAKKTAAKKGAAKKTAGRKTAAKGARKA